MRSPHRRTPCQSVQAHQQDLCSDPSRRELSRLSCPCTGLMQTGPAAGGDAAEGGDIPPDTGPPDCEASDSRVCKKNCPAWLPTSGRTAVSVLRLRQQHRADLSRTRPAPIPMRRRPLSSREDSRVSGTLPAVRPAACSAICPDVCSRTGQDKACHTASCRPQNLQPVLSADCPDSQPSLQARDRQPASVRQQAGLSRHRPFQPPRQPENLPARRRPFSASRRRWRGSGICAAGSSVSTFR